MIILYVGFAGFLGAVLRVSLGSLLTMIQPATLFPYPTLIINLIGSFSLAYFLSTSKLKLKPEYKTAISTGFLGSFTTFSTFSVETLHLFQIQAYLFAILYMVGSFIGGFIFTYFGIKLGLSKIGVEEGH